VSTSRLTAGEPVRPCHRTKHPFELAKQLGDLPLLSTGDELLNGSGDGGFFGALSSHPKGSIEQLLDESMMRGHVRLLSWGER
jgi:hypothetical protein